METHEVEVLDPRPNRTGIATPQQVEAIERF
jgi:hypothetical protein